METDSPGEICAAADTALAVTLRLPFPGFGGSSSPNRLAAAEARHHQSTAARLIIAALREAVLAIVGIAPEVCMETGGLEVTVLAGSEGASATAMGLELVRAADGTISSSAFSAHRTVTALLARCRSLRLVDARARPRAPVQADEAATGATVACDSNAVTTHAAMTLIRLDVLVDFLREHAQAVKERSALHLAAELGKIEVAFSHFLSCLACLVQ